MKPFMLELPEDGGGGGGGGGRRRRCLPSYLNIYRPVEENIPLVLSLLGFLF